MIPVENVSKTCPKSACEVSKYMKIQ